MEQLLDKRGATLIEIILSLAILSIIIIPLYNALITSSKMEQEAEAELIGANVAEKIIEQRRAGVGTPVSIEDYAYRLEEETNIEGYIIEEELYLYDGLFRIDEATGGSRILAYKRRGNRRIQVGNIFHTSSSQLSLHVYSNQITLVQTGANSGTLTIPYIIRNESIKVGIETFNHDLEVSVSNETSGVQVYLYTATLHTGDIQGTGSISILENTGDIQIREMQEQEEQRQRYTELLRKIRVKVSKGETYNDDNKLVEIDTMKKE